LSAPRPWLDALAARLGVLPSYWDIRGTLHRTRPETAVALLAAMGVDASDEAAAARSHQALERDEAARRIEPVLVWRQWRGADPFVPARAGAAPADYALALRSEEGREAVVEGRLEGRPGEPVRLALPFRPDPGYHRVRLALSAGGGEETAEQRLIVAPRRCLGVREALGDAPRFGLWTNLYTLRSARNHGIGDLGDLATLARFTAACGGEFLGINPLHALRNRGSGISPYSPVSRLFRSPLYVALDAVPEWEEAPALRARLSGVGGDADPVRPLREADRVDYDAVLRLKREALEELHAIFRARHAGRDTERGRAHAAWLRRGGEALTGFATFCALEEHLSAGRRWHLPFTEWPEGLRDPHGPEVARFRSEHAALVDFHAWVQFELDRQLAAAAQAGRDAGLGLGIYQDLAIGLASDAADIWAWPGLFAHGASVGAPPDDYAPQGQDWGLPPLDPHRLRADGYDYFVRLLRAAFAHAGALRIDHVMGLFRLYWIPAGRSGAEGAYVRYPAEDLLGILALESRRHGAVVVGEDLGTVPDEVPPMLEDWAVLSSKVLLFERDRSGAFLPPARYAPRAMVTANTHDLPTLAAFAAGSDIDLRHGLDPGATAEDLGRARAGRRDELERLLQRLRSEGLLPDGRSPDYPALRDAVHAFLCRTPCALAGLSLDDLEGEREPVNLPGFALDRFPSWSRRMRRELETLVVDPALRRALAPCLALRPPPRPVAAGD